MVDAGRHVVAVGPGAAEEGAGARRAVAGGQDGEVALDLQLALRQRQGDEARQARRGRDLLEQGLDVGGADHRQHGGAVGGGEGQVAHAHRPPR